jgi:hypothetical protein
MNVDITQDDHELTWALTSSSSTAIKVTFSEAVSKATTFLPLDGVNFVIKNSAGTVIVPISAVPTGNVYEVTYAALPAAGDTYTVTIVNVVDNSIYHNPVAGGILFRDWSAEDAHTDNGARGSNGIGHVVNYGS